MQNQLEEVIREKKEKFYAFKSSSNKNSDPISTNNSTKTGEAQGKYSGGTAFIYGGLDFKWYHTREIQQERKHC